MEIEARAWRLCVVIAADIEYKTIAGLLAGAAPNLCEQSEHYALTLLKAEIGAPDFAAKLAAHLAVHSCEALLVIGLAGALTPQLKTGDAVVYDLCFDARRAFAAPEGPALTSLLCDAQFSNQLFESLRAAGRRVRRGASVMTEKVICSAATKAALGLHYGAVAVDMETYEIAAAAARCGLPCAALRIVLDEVWCDLPDFNRGMAAGGRLQTEQMLLALLARPLASWRFFRSLRPALRALRECSRIVLEQLGRPINTPVEGAKPPRRGVDNSLLAR